jgi:hypothetical protein
MKLFLLSIFAFQYQRVCHEAQLHHARHLCGLAPIYKANSCLDSLASIPLILVFLQIH